MEVEASQRREDIITTTNVNGDLIAFSRDDIIPLTGKVVVKNKLLAEAVLESIIGRLAQLMNKNKVEEEANDLSLGDN
ncbi:unnamed protein product [Arabidopsis lyrata]|uniref:Chalcone-flavonone isomerase family protein n=1 Tax=Arabidopsis lyrata subsp. lyrata TaxID=81972 RepID=D7KXA5_ARALL|nr:predicted protein [Arabidopsis lyrata subsp. lyrata]CAH8256383.1 unnamed protein product [Arabidopsis lyrata]